MKNDIESSSFENKMQFNLMKNDTESSSFKHKIKFNLIILITILLFNLICANMLKCLGANYSFNFTGPTECSKGDTITLTITATGLTGNVKLTATNATLSDSQKWVEKNSVSITAKVTEFPAKITAEPVELTDNDYNIVSISSKTVTVNEKQTASTTTTTPSSSSSSQTASSTTSTGKTTTQTTTAPPTTSTSQSKATQSSSSSKASQTTTSTTTGKQSADQTISQPQYQVAVEDQSKVVTSSNNYLKSLSVNVGTLSPNFTRETFDYTIDNIIENEIEIKAEAEDANAIVSGTGTISLINGENKIVIGVTAPNGSVRNYNIIVNKPYQIQQSDLRLDSLSVETINGKGEFNSIDINFNKDTFDYNINVADDITDFNILPSVTHEGIIVQTEGANNLKAGANKITITLTSQNDTSLKTVYTITVNKAEKVILTSTTNTKNSNWTIVWLLIIIAVIVIATISVYIIRKKKNMIKVK